MIFQQPVHTDSECMTFSHALPTNIPEIKKPLHCKKRIFIIYLRKHLTNPLIAPIPHTAHGEIRIQQLFSGGSVTNRTIFCCLIFLCHLFIQFIHKCHLLNLHTVCFSLWLQIASELFEYWLLESNQPSQDPPNHPLKILL